MTAAALAATLAGAAALPGLAAAQTNEASAATAADQQAPPGSDADKAAPEQAVQTVVISSHTTRSSVSLRGAEIQKILPGTNPIKSLQTLPGVNFQTADPWGNNEQNLSLYVHGFSGQQLGYTLDGAPLGDQQYGNYNGLSPQRAISSENVRSVILSSGAGSLSTASTSNLGGTIETYSSDPAKERGGRVEQTVGSYSAARTFARFDTGVFGDGNSAYLSAMRLDARAWDFDGHQGGKQFNAKFVRDTAPATITLYFNYIDKIEPNEDATVRTATETNPPYTRAFTYPNFAAALAYLSPTGATPGADGNNYHNYYSDAQRTDYLAYARIEGRPSENSRWTAQAYYHDDDGVGVVAGPIGVAGLPALFGVYFPNQNLKHVFGDSGYATRATEYWIGRGGLIGSYHTELGEHTLEAGAWWEHNSMTAYRRWFALDVNAPTSPYDRPQNPLITQYGSDIKNNVVQLYLQDEWHVRPDLRLQAGFKSSLQFASGTFPVQPKVGAIAGGSTAFPEGEIITRKWFLPQLGALWDLPDQDQVFVNIQKNLRQFITYGAGAPSPWSLSNQAAFDLFRDTAEPETSITYEIGARGRRKLALGPFTAIDGQVSLYHVDFSNRLLQISATAAVNSIVGANPILSNVGSVKTNGIDLAATIYAGKRFSFYNSLSYNRSAYGDDYHNGATLVPTSGKIVPGVPLWMDKFVASANSGPFEAQLTGDYVGKQYTTFTNDLSVPSHFLLGLSVAAKFAAPVAGVKNAKLTLSITNLSQERGWQGLVIGAASGTYNSYPIAPRQLFLTLGANF
ncbi:MAG: TonB-dependent receptor plug domain-containing protein [Pseudomonadota bacterium]